MAEQSAHVELNRLDVVPADAVERCVAQKASVRSEKLRANEVGTVCASEDWVRLLIDLRRAHPHHTRITLALTNQWKTKSTSSASVNRKCFIVETAALDALPDAHLIWTSGSFPGMIWCSRLTSTSMAS